jgi:hypothetical protein
MKEDRPGVLVCICGADGKILLNAPYDCEDVRIYEQRKKRMSTTGRTPDSRERGEEDAESGHV